MIFYSNFALRLYVSELEFVIVGYDLTFSFVKKGGYSIDSIGVKFSNLIIFEKVVWVFIEELSRFFRPTYYPFDVVQIKILLQYR